jgi:hypothetical protein
MCWLLKSFRFNSTTQGVFLSQQPSDERKGMILWQADL